MAESTRAPCQREFKVQEGVGTVVGQGWAEYNFTMKSPEIKLSRKWYV